MNIIKSSVLMRLEPNETAFLETECLFGEVVEIIDEYVDWFYCKLTTDNYSGWIKKDSIGQLRKLTHRVINKRSFIYKEANAKSNIILYLPMGSRLAIEEIRSDWAKACFLLDNKFQVGFVPSSHIVNNEHKFKDWVGVAQKLEGTPYRWGGRDTIGIDCSALLQLSYQTYGQIIPRNTSKQVTLKKPEICQISHLKRGCVIFWKGHVGIMIDTENCIHANAFHMQTLTEPLSSIIKRIDKDHQIIKMMDFN